MIGANISLRLSQMVASLMLLSVGVAIGFFFGASSNANNGHAAEETRGEKVIDNKSGSPKVKAPRTVKDETSKVISYSEFLTSINVGLVENVSFPSHRILFYHSKSAAATELFRVILPPMGIHHATLIELLRQKSVRFEYQPSSVTAKGDTTDTIAYSEFLNKIESGVVERLSFTTDRFVLTHLRSSQSTARSQVILPPMGLHQETLIRLLVENGVRFEYEVPRKTSINSRES